MVWKINNKDTLSNVNQYDNHLPSIDDADLRKLIHQYQKVFWDSLFKKFPPKQEVECAIEIDNAKPVNINAYLQFKAHIDE